MSIAIAEWCQVPTRLDQFEDRRGVVRGVIDEMPLREWRNNDRWHARSSPPSIDLWARDMVPSATVARVRYDNHGVIPDLTPLDFVNDLGGMVVAANEAGITGMLVVRADRLVESYGRERSGSDSTYH